MNLVSKVCCVRRAHVAIRQTDHRRGRANTQIERGDVPAFRERFFLSKRRVVQKCSVPSTVAFVKLEGDVFLLTLQFSRVAHEIDFAVQVAKRALANADRA